MIRMHSLLGVFLVLVVINISASVYIDFKEELPLYLTDDFLISKLGKISKRSITNNVQTHLTGREKITKRSADEDSDKSKSPTTKQPYGQIENRELENEEESGLVFLPSFGKRTRRSVVERDVASSKEDNKKIPNSQTERNEELYNSESQEQQSRRSRRDNISSEGTTKSENHGSSTTESNHETNKNESQAEQESGLVFLPTFGRRTRREVSKREATSSNNDKTKPHKDSEKNSDESKNEFEDEEESGLVFLPSFGRRSKREAVKSKNSSDDSKMVSNATTTTTQRNEKQSEEQSEAQESGLVFLPSFGRRTRRHLSKREATSSNNDNAKPHKDSEKNSEESKNEFEDEEESGLVFLPSFGKRSKREAVKPENSLDDSKKASNASSTTTQRNEKQSEEQSEAQESGLVFLPSFGRRTRRHISKRDATSSNNDKTKSHKDFEKNSEESKKEFQDEEESGLVFLPSFGRRSKREVVKPENPPEDSKKVNNATSTTTQKNEKQSEEQSEAQESGIVFLPSFGRRTRRNVPVSETKNESTPATGKPTLKNSKIDESETGQESGLVFLPSFGRRTRRDLLSHENNRVMFKRDIGSKSRTSLNVDKQKKEDQEIGNDMDRSENGMVFLAQFGKKN